MLRWLTVPDNNRIQLQPTPQTAGQGAGGKYNIRATLQQNHNHQSNPKNILHTFNYNNVVT